jgi:hypothetical protein
MRTERELFSYRFPANGPLHFRGPGFPLLAWLKVMAELAQLNSECLHAVLRTKGYPTVGFDAAILALGFLHDLDREVILDDEDHLRVTQMARRSGGHPANLQSMCSEGFVDDFFGAWEPEAEDDIGVDGKFDPTPFTREIFDFR